MTCLAQLSSFVSYLPKIEVLLSTGEGAPEPMCVGPPASQERRESAKFLICQLGKMSVNPDVLILLITFGVGAARESRGA